MPFNGSGIFTLAEPAFVANTSISSAAVNSDLSDIADGLTTCFTNDGQSTMSAPAKMFAGTLTNPGWTWGNDTNTGRYRPDADEQTDVCGGVAVMEQTPEGVNFPLKVMQGGASIIPIGLGPLQWTGETAPPGWVLTGATYLRADYPDLWSFAQTQIGLGNTFYGSGNGTTTFTVGSMDGYAPVGVDPSGTVLGGVTEIGNTVGNKTSTIITANLPPYTPAGSITDPGHHHAFGTFAAAIAMAAGAVSVPFSNDTANTQDATTGVSFSGTPQGGTSTPLSVVQPSRAFKFIVYAGA